MNVTIKFIEELKVEDLPLLNACIERAHRSIGERTVECSVVCNARSRDGWLELHTLYKYDDGGKLLVAGIQRNTGEPFEFHS